MDSLRGKLLIASPALVDPNFHRSAVLVAEHSEEGAMGVILNRPTQATVGEAVPELGGLLDEGGTVYEGGPVAQTGIVVLGEFSDPSVAAARVHERLGFVALQSDPDEVADKVVRARAFAGHAGWGAGQLEAELEEEAWIVAPFHPDDAFSDEAGRLWSAGLRRLGGRYALLARMPADPSVN